MVVACIDVASKGSTNALDNPVDITFLIQNFSNLPASLHNPLIRLGFSEVALDTQRLRLFLKPRVDHLR